MHSRGVSYLMYFPIRRRYVGVTRVSQPLYTTPIIRSRVPELNRDVSQYVGG